MNEKQKVNPMFFICLVCGIVASTFVLEIGDSILAAGLECGIGAVCGSILFYILAPFFGWTLFK